MADILNYVPVSKQVRATVALYVYILDVVKWPEDFFFFLPLLNIFGKDLITYAKFHSRYIIDKKNTQIDWHSLLQGNAVPKVKFIVICFMMRMQKGILYCFVFRELMQSHHSYRQGNSEFPNCIRISTTVASLPFTKLCSLSFTMSVTR